MRNNLLCLLTLLLVLSGCTASIEDDPAPESTYYLQRKLSEITFDSGNGMTIDLTYGYNDSKQLTWIGGVLIRDTIEQAVNTTIAYDNQGRATHFQKKSGTTWTNTYDEKNQLIKQVRDNIDTEPFSYLHFYNDADQLVEVKTYKLQDKTEAYVGNIVFSYATGNQVSITRTLASGEVEREYTIVTDDKRRALPAHPIQIAPDFFYSDVYAEGIFTSHNIISNDIVDGEDKIRYGGSYKSRYSYNEAGLPVVCFKTFEEGTVEKITYTYIKE